MFDNTGLGLVNSWKSLAGIIYGTIKTQADKDLRFSCMNSFLASWSMEYEVDRFSYFWTAKNAYHCFVYKILEEHLMLKGDAYENDRG